jgi:hypothetical protein
MEAAIQDAITDGEHVREIRNRIIGVLNTSKEHATVIARTEATASLNYGQQALRTDEDVPNKLWISTIDGDTRETHVSADQQVVANRDNFMVGGYPMSHPGDGSHGAPAEEIVQCRCTATGTYE